MRVTVALNIFRSNQCTFNNALRCIIIILIILIFIIFVFHVVVDFKLLLFFLTMSLIPFFYFIHQMRDRCATWRRLHGGLEKEGRGEGGGRKEEEGGGRKRKNGEGKKEE